jgi:hyaluronan synthase
MRTISLSRLGASDAVRGGGREGLLLRTGLVAGGLALVVVVWWVDLGTSRGAVAQELLGAWRPLLAWPALAMAATVGGSMAWRVWLWWTYRPVPALRRDDPGLPDLTVVIPAYNEGPGVRRAIASVLASDYPVERLRVVVVDDGSVDDTWAHVRAATASQPRAEAIRLDRNRGKRHALFAGFQRVRTPVVVTVDSDTEVPREALRALVAPLAQDPEVGAVAGRIEARNRQDNVLTRMLGVRYRIGFDFVRAYQSRLRSVFVCPGALSAYRMAAIADHLEAWRDQRFLGNACTNGDDHALTNHLLSRGVATVYQGNAVGRTAVPNTYRGLTLMYVRWARSNVRESLRYLAFVPRLVRRPARWPAVADALVRFVQIPLRLWLLGVGTLLIVMHPAILIRSAAAVTAFSLFHVAVFLRHERSWDAVYAMLYALFSLFTLQWIYPWATVTVRQSRWLTR